MKARRLLVVAILALPACSTLSVGQVRGIKPLNVNEQAESTPVDVRFYQLKDDARFKEAAVEKLWTDDKVALGADFVAVKTITVIPGTVESKAAMIELGDLPVDVRFVGVLALFPKEDKKGPRKLVFSAKDARGFSLLFTEYHVSKEP